MFALSRHAWFAGLTALAVWAAAPSAGIAQPTKIIFDTDFQTDSDDAGALGILHAMADNGEAEILATIVSARNPWSVAAVDVINTYYGRPDIPIAALQGPGVNINSPYAQGLAERFPHDTSSVNAPDAVTLYREMLASQDDGSVTLMTVGYATNVRDLLASGPDDISPLSGAELVARKVDKWVNMGGNFEHRTTADGYPYSMNTTNVNWERDAGAAITAINDWPTDLVFVGREIGHSLRSGAVLNDTPADNPVRVAYELHHGSAKDHHLADLSTVLYGVRGLEHDGDQYWAYESGQIEMRSGAKFDWNVGATGPRSEARIVDALTRPDLGLLSLSEIETVVDDLLAQAPAGPDTTPPTAPGALDAQADATFAGKYELTWTPAAESDAGSWLAGYRVYRGGELVGRTIGTRFVDFVPTVGEHAYEVAAFNVSGAESERTALTITANTSAGAGEGLQAEYFNNKDLSGDPVLTRIDPQLNFDWGGGSPVEGLGDDGYSVRWSGQIESAHAQGLLTYTFTTLSNDGVRMWIDGELVIDSWKNGGGQINTAEIELEAGRRYDIVVEYYENTVTAQVELRWEAAGLPQEAVPTRRLYAVPEPTAASAIGVGAALLVGGRRR